MAFIQFSSGTTSAPQRRRADGARDRCSAAVGWPLPWLKIDPATGTSGSMWLPLSHDMGFFGGDLLAYYTGMRGILLGPRAVPG